MADGLIVESQGEIVVVTVERGDGNMFTGEMIDELVGVVELASTEPDRRLVRLRSIGRNFCTGREREGQTPDELRAEAARIVRANEALKNSPLIVLAEVQGDAAGFGAGLVAASDVAIASEHAAISFPEILAGLAPTIVIGWASFLIPYKRAFEMVATGRRMSASDALRHGLVTEVVPADQLTPRADEVATDLMSKPSSGLREIKRFFAQVRSLDPVSAAHASIDPLVLASLRLASQAPPGTTR